MNGVGIILGSTQINSSEFENIGLHKLVAVYGASIGMLSDLINIPDSDEIINKASKETGMTCEYDVLLEQISIEKEKIKQRIKKMHPIRHRLSILKTLLKSPASSVAGIILMGKKDGN